MYGEERRETIVRQARLQGRVGVTELAESFGVALETIRRDLATLETSGVLRRVHGGAVPIERLSVEPDLATRALTMTAEKERIGKAALQYVPERGSVFIEAGNTPGHLARLLPADRELTVVTNGGYLALALAVQRNLTVISVGGRVRSRSLACVDDLALENLGRLHVEVAFLGTNGLSLEGGLTTPDPSEAAVKRATLRLGRRTILLADHTKVGQVSVCRYGEVADVDVLVTDTGLAASQAAELEAAGPQVVRA